MRRHAKRAPQEPTIALINVVFLLLVFFIVAGTLARPLDADLRLVRTAGLDGAAPPDALVLHPDGRVTHAGAGIDPAAHVAALDETARAVLRVVPDREAPAADLVALGRTLRSAGAGRVVIVTERGLE
ncbi:ExbD/TolR family protein [Rhodovulum euryhalinum]|uniref:Biopolymer transport protein ExbD n=1 Tax=Rhodovulum euryhalinum TaxID=35805 RepID=A0A4V2SB48_9RHOB|nr:biopolymer transporter ExbD [Rhodovulum euryhalinum]TCO74140.1 biopolymer transport protein ExbD [Rhodovulum euryhalinum]